MKKYIIVLFVVMAVLAGCTKGKNSKTAESVTASGQTEVSPSLSESPETAGAEEGKPDTAKKSSQEESEEGMESEEPMVSEMLVTWDPDGEHPFVTKVPVPQTTETMPPQVTKKLSQSEKEDNTEKVSIHPKQWDNMDSYDGCYLEDIKDAPWDCNYSFVTKTFSYKLEDGTKKAFDYPQVTGMKSTKIQAKVNKNLKKACTEWVTDSVWWIDDMDYKISYMSEKYLSVRCVLNKDNDSANFGVTLDMETGKPIRFSELLDVSKFKQKLNAMMEFWSGRTQKKDLFDERMEEIVTTIKERYDAQSSKSRSYGYIQNYPSWYLINDGLYLDEIEMEYPYAVVPMIDLEDVLKVEKW